jgi:hypothetical protein
MAHSTAEEIDCPSKNQQANKKKDMGFLVLRGQNKDETSIFRSVLTNIKLP